MNRRGFFRMAGAALAAAAAVPVSALAKLPQAAAPSLIVDGGTAITAKKLADCAITADKIAANAITANKIRAGAVYADHISVGTIPRDRIKTSKLVINDFSLQYDFFGRAYRTAFDGSRVFV